MRGDKLIIAPHHTEMAAELCASVLAASPTERLVISIAGESGAGKSELASELCRLLNEHGSRTTILQQDDYFVFPPKTNHAMRKLNLAQVGMYEVKLGLLDSNLRSFKRGETPIYKPLVDYDADQIDWIELDLAGIDVVIAEGTYTTTLRFADIRVFIDRDFEDTKAHRQQRARDADDSFMSDVLKREHDIISRHRSTADFVVAKNFDELSGPQRQS